MQLVGGRKVLLALLLIAVLIGGSLGVLFVYADFSVTVPKSVTVASGESVTVTVAVSSRFLFPWPVAITVDGTPQGISYTISPPIINLLTDNPSTVLLVLSPDTVAPGTYSLTIKAWGGGKTYRSPLELIVTQPLEALYLLSHFFTNSSYLTMTVENRGIANATLTGYAFKDPSGNSYQRSVWPGGELAPASPRKVTLNIAGGTYSGNSFNFKSGETYTVTLTSNRANQFSFSLLARIVTVREVVAGDGTEVSVSVNPLDSRNIAAAHNFGPDGGVYYTKDGGLTWSASALLSKNFRADPYTAFDGNGQLYYLFLMRNGTLYQLNIAKSSDGGGSFQWEKMIAGNGTFVGYPSGQQGRICQGGVPALVDYPKMAVDLSIGSAYYNSLYLVFAAYVDRLDNVCRWYQLFSRSTDGGVTFTTPLAISEDPTTKSSLGTHSENVAVAADGTVFTSVKGSTGAYLLRSGDGGVSFTIMGPFFGSTGGSRTVLASSPRPGESSFLYAAFMEYLGTGATGPIYTIKAALSKDQGQTWSTPIVVPDDSPSDVHDSPVLVVDSRGNVHVLWWDNRNDTTSRQRGDVFYSYSESEALVFSPNVRVSGVTAYLIVGGNDYFSAVFYGSTIITGYARSNQGSGYQVYVSTVTP